MLVTVAHGLCVGWVMGGVYVWRGAPEHREEKERKGREKAEGVFNSLKKNKERSIKENEMNLLVYVFGLEIDWIYF